MKKFLTFRCMITPFIIQLLFWIAVVLSVVTAIHNFRKGHHRFAIEALILGPLLARIGAEIIIVWFRIYDTLDSISHYENENRKINN